MPKCQNYHADKRILVAGFWHPLSLIKVADNRYRSHDFSWLGQDFFSAHYQSLYLSSKGCQKIELSGYKPKNKTKQKIKYASLLLETV